MKKRIVAFISILSAITCSFSQENKTVIGFNGKVPNPYSEYFKQAYARNPSIPKGLLEAVSFTITRFEHRVNQNAASCTGMPCYYGVMGLVKDGKGTLRNNLITVSRLSGCK